MAKWLSRKAQRKQGDGRARTDAARGDAPPTAGQLPGRISNADEPTLRARGGESLAGNAPTHDDPNFGRRRGDRRRADRRAAGPFDDGGRHGAQTSQPTAEHRSVDANAIDEDTRAHEPILRDEPTWQDWHDDDRGLSRNDQHEAAQAAALDLQADLAEESRRLWLWAILIALIGLTARAIFYARFPDEWYFRLGPDGESYLAIANYFVNGGLTDASTFIRPDLREVFPPGYPLLIASIMSQFSEQAVSGPSDSLLVTIRALQWLLATAVVLMTFALSRRVLFGRTALIPPVLLTISIAWIDMPSLIAYETLLAFLLLASILLLVKAHEKVDQSSNARVYVWLAAAAFGYAVITQPRVLVILPFLAVWAWRSLPRSYFGVLMVVSLLPILLWMGRMYAVYDKVVPLSINGPASVYLDNVDPIGGTGFVKHAAPPECPRRMLFTQERFEWASCMRNEGFAQIAAHPDKSLIAIPDRLAALFSPWNPTRARGTYASDHWDYHFVVPASVKESSAFWTADRIANYLWVALYVLLAAIGVAVLWVEGIRSSARLIAIPIVSLPLVHLIFHAENRFRLPMTPFLMIAIALALVTIFESIRSGRSRGGGREV